MTSNDFAELIKRVVHDAAIQDTINNLSAPAGRKPSPSLKKLSAWYGRLNSEDRENVRALVRHAVHAATFGFLCVLDGVRAAVPRDQELELNVLEHGDRKRINVDRGEMLHDAYQSLVWDEVFEETTGGRDGSA